MTIEFWEFSLGTALNGQFYYALSPIPLTRNTTHTFRASLPGDFGDNATRQDVSREILIEMYSCTRVIDAYKYNVLIACMGRAGTVMSAGRG